MSDPIDVMPAARDDEAWPPPTERHELERPRPSCVVCSREWSRRAGVPARCVVERAIVIRDLVRGYLVVAHCHGQVATWTFGPDMPTERAIAALSLFTGV